MDAPSLPYTCFDLLTSPVEVSLAPQVVKRGRYTETLRPQDRLMRQIFNYFEKGIDERFRLVKYQPASGIKDDEYYAYYKDGEDSGYGSQPTIPDLR
jgi:hypothetical protein